MLKANEIALQKASIAVKKLQTGIIKKSFETSIFSDVYDLSFEDLNVNLILGNIRKIILILL